MRSWQASVSIFLKCQKIALFLQEMFQTLRFFDDLPRCKRENTVTPLARVHVNRAEQLQKATCR